MKPGPLKDSSGAIKIGNTHRGPHPHDKKGGFAANRELAREAGRRGGETIKREYGLDFYREIGKKGGDIVKKRGSEYYAEIGRKGGKARKKKHESQSEKLT